MKGALKLEVRMLRPTACCGATAYIEFGLLPFKSRVSMSVSEQLDCCVDVDSPLTCRCFVGDPRRRGDAFLDVPGDGLNSVGCS